VWHRGRSSGHPPPRELWTIERRRRRTGLGLKRRRVGGGERKVGRRGGVCEAEAEKAPSPRKGGGSET